MSARAIGGLGPRWRRALTVVLVIVVALVLAVALFPWDWLRGPINRYVSERTGRHFEITRRLDVDIGWHIRIVADGLVFGNPPWATEPNLIEAERVEAEVRLWPLLTRWRLELPLIAMSQPRLGLELLPDGRRTWTLEREGQEDSAIVVGAMEVDRGQLRYIAQHQGADVQADFAMDAPAAGQGPQLLPLSFRGGGRWHGENFVLEGRSGNVLALREGLGNPLPLEIFATSGRSSLRMAGRVVSLATFDGADLSVAMRGRDLAELYRLVGIALPETPPYTVEGRLQRQGAVWRASELRGTLGRTDLRGEMSYDVSGDKPVLVGSLQSRRLDFDDLAPLIGKREDAPRARRGARPAQGDRQVLPRAPLDLSRLRSMDADVRFAADRVVDAKPVPVDRLSVHVRLQDGLLQLEPLDAGLAGGRLTGSFRVSGRQKPAEFALQLQVRGLNLERLFPAVDLNRASVGQVHGRVALGGRGASVAQMLGSASGDVALLLGRGRISNLLLEFAGLDGAEIVRFLLGRDQRVELRCAAAAFHVKDGLMSSRALVLDTVDTVIYGQGTINLADERLDLIFRPYPKDASILALRSPLKLSGTLGAPEGGIEKGPLVARAAAAIALGAINPLLALAATIETGPGEDADCGAVLKQAATPNKPPPVPAPPVPASAAAARAASGR
ncbi:AsmA family protein [Ramlibacter sp. AW1]|uniref:AsmA family protein n=1 Tax=Ramlibacter aurantiacus TaxID=2801330 RepID=A0A937D5Q1_9BURK|nr:AsmA family protein [Ramlibacter aurantiacus]MBL0420143.1 AsmA family protein [Ramlibacter aurantiacus]